MTTSAVAATVPVLLFGASEVAPAGAKQSHQSSGVNAVIGRSAAVQGLLVSEFGSVSTITLASKRLPVPARVRLFPLGLSPDSRLVAGVTAAGAVLLCPVRSGSMKTVLQGNCPSCPEGADPTYAWSPDSRQLAVAANPTHGATLLKLVDRGGHIVRSFTLPGGSPRLFHKLESWSPDGSRLLLTQSDEFGAQAVIVLDVKTGGLWAWRPPVGWGPGNRPRLVWSPDGRFFAVTSTGTQDASDVFAVIGVAAARAVFLRTSGKGELPEASTVPVWAPDGRSLFARARVVSTAMRPPRVSSRIDRLYLDGRRANLIGSSAGWLTPRVALPSGLVYEASHDDGRAALYVYSFATRHSDLLFSSRRGIDAVLPLAHLP